MTADDDGAPVAPRHLGEPAAAARADERRWRIAIWTVIASEALLFSGLFALYAAYRREHEEAFAAGVRADLGWVGGAGTLVLLTSSLAMAWSIRAARDGHRREAAASLLAVLALGAGFLVLKAIEWADHIGHGILPGRAYAGPDHGPGTPLFAALYYGMTGLHALHVLAGLALVAWMLLRVRRARIDRDHHLGLELVGLYWHFVDGVWVFLWPLFYLMRG